MPHESVRLSGGPSLRRKPSALTVFSTICNGNRCHRERNAQKTRHDKHSKRRTSARHLSRSEGIRPHLAILLPRCFEHGWLGLRGCTCGGLLLLRCGLDAAVLCRGSCGWLRLYGLCSHGLLLASRYSLLGRLGSSGGSHSRSHRRHRHKATCDRGSDSNKTIKGAPSCFRTDRHVLAGRSGHPRSTVDSKVEELSEQASYFNAGNFRTPVHTLERAPPSPRGT